MKFSKKRDLDTADTSASTATSGVPKKRMLCANTLRINVEQKIISDNMIKLTDLVAK